MFFDDLEIEWDPAKDEINFKKHGIHFEEAAQVFQAPLAVFCSGPNRKRRRTVANSWNDFYLHGHPGRPYSRYWRYRDNTNH